MEATTFWILQRTRWSNFSINYVISKWLSRDLRRGLSNCAVMSDRIQMVFLPWSALQFGAGYLLSLQLLLCTIRDCVRSLLRVKILSFYEAMALTA